MGSLSQPDRPGERNVFSPEHICLYAFLPSAGKVGFRLKNENILINNTFADAAETGIIVLICQSLEQLIQFIVEH